MKPSVLGMRREQSSFKGLNEIGEDLNATQKDYETHVHGKMARQEKKRLEGSFDLGKGVRGCYCDDCIAKRQLPADRRKQLETEVGIRGQADFNRGVLDCSCDECTIPRTFEAQHNELKRKTRLGRNNNFKDGVSGCKCVECRSRNSAASRKAQKSRHERLKKQELITGKSGFAEGVPGCEFSCQECFKAKVRVQKAQQRKLKREEWMRGTNDFEKGVPGCGCRNCMGKKFGLKMKPVYSSDENTTPATSCRNSPAPEEERVQISKPINRATKPCLTSSEVSESQPSPKKRSIRLPSCIQS